MARVADPSSPRSSLAARTSLLASLLVAACGGGPSTPSVTPSATPTPEPTGPPNVVFVVADDLGWGDLPSYGSPTNRTPNLDRLAESGVRMTQYVTAAPLCTPSRAALLTGLYPVQTRVMANLGPRDTRPGLTAETPSLALVLRGRGYATAAVGKWGIGDQPQNMPLQNGFDSYFGVPYESDERIFEGDGLAPVGVPFNQLEAEYTRRAKVFIRQHANQRPFFLYYASHIPHQPLRTHPDFVGRSGAGSYADAILELDSRVGEILDTLRESGVDRNTIVFFASDNGPPSYGRPDDGSPGPFGGVGKGSPYEGGIRVPGILSWPAVIPGRRVQEGLVSALDLVPTVAAAAGATLPGRFLYFGADVMPLLRGQTANLAGPGMDGGRELISFVGSNPGAFRSGRYKIVWPGWWANDAELYDLALDPYETKNLRRKEPGLFDTVAARCDSVLSEASRTAIRE